MSAIVCVHKYYFHYLFFILNLLVNCEPVHPKNKFYAPDNPSSTISSRCQDLTIHANKINSISPTSSASTNRNEFIFQFSNGQINTLTSDFEIIWTAPEPLEFTYHGFADEEMGLTAVSERFESDGGSCYMLKLVQKQSLNSKDTGLYTGRYISNHKKISSVYLYVPNRYPPYLLNTERLVTVNWREGKPLVLPCLLNDPNVEVKLSKRKGLNEWQEIPNLSSYHPQSGFLIKKPFNGGTTLFGSYKCFTKLHNRNDTIFLNVIPV